MRTIVFTENVHRDEKAQLKDYLDDNSWKASELSKDELNGIVSLINYAINKRIGDEASGLSYTELLTLKNKLQS